MVRTIFHTSSALAVLVVVAGLAQGQETRPVARGERAATAVRAKSLLGATVSLKGGTRVGTVEDIVLNDEGVVDYLVVSESGKLVTVPWDAARFNYEKRTAVINISPEQFRRVPTYSATEYPQFYSPEYRTEVYRFYNLPAGRARRLERRQ